MILFVLGFMDLISGVFLILHYFHLIHWNLLIAPMLYLFIKFYVFPEDFASYIDLLIAIYFVFAILGLNIFFSLIFGMYLIEKGVQSLIML